MPGREEPRDLVQDPVRARADPATQATDHGLLELGILVDCCESGPKCSEDARDEDFDLVSPSLIFQRKIVVAEGNHDRTTLKLEIRLPSTKSICYHEEGM